MEKIVVLMSSYNGEKYIKEQLDSIFAQKNVDVHVLVRDDGSHDSTCRILDEYKTSGKLEWYGGRNLRSARSFMDLVYRAPTAEYYAFADQDDVWDEDKLCTAIDMIKKEDATKPVLYSCPTRLVDKNLKPIGTAKHNRSYTHDFAGSLIGSNATGCTVVFNGVLLKYLQKFHGQNITMHDSLAHKVCCALGGVLVRDKTARVSYRQHGDNVVGVKKHGILYKWRKRLSSIKNPKCERSRFLKEIYSVYGDLMSDENRKLLYDVANYKEIPMGKLKVIVNPRLKGGYTLMSINFRLAVLMGTF